MKCPPDIAVVLLEILTTALLRIRAMGCSDGTFLEADHVHDLPALLRDYSPALLKYYWEAERPSFIGLCAHAAQFEPLWEELRRRMDLNDTVKPVPDVIPSPPSPLPR